MSDGLPTPSEAIKRILDTHGADAIYVFATGWISRTAYHVCNGEYHALFMQGSMGQAPTIALGIALNTRHEVVAVNGDGALLMALGATHTAHEYAPGTFYHYVLDNGCYESVGGQRCVPLAQEDYLGVTEIIRVGEGCKSDRVGVSPRDNAAAIAAVLQQG